MSDAGGQTAAMQTPVAHGEPCQECGAPLAADQRYCLNCGRRRGDPRVDYRHYMAPAGPGQSGAPPSAQAAPSPGSADASRVDPAIGGSTQQAAQKGRDYTPLAAVGGIAVLGLMLLVGVLIGRGGDSSAPAPAPVVVRGGEEGAENTSGAGEEGAGAKSAAKGAAKSGGKGKGASLNGGSGKEEEPVEASTEALESLHSESGASYEEQSKKLPNKIATPGAPPPIDKTKPPGGGEGGAEVIK